MKEKPILFSGPMVRAILDGQKTQTRRIVKGIDQAWDHREREGRHFFHDGEGSGTHFNQCPMGAPGDRLWVKETHYKYGYWVKNGKTDKGRQKWKFVQTRNDVRYWDTAPMVIMRNSDRRHGWYKRPSLFMRRVDSRILLEITDTRVERLNDISEADASAEGANLEWYGDNAGSADLWPCPQCRGFQVHQAAGPNMGAVEIDCQDCDTSKKMFQHLWESINGPGSWDDNPYVWCIDFKRLL